MITKTLQTLIDEVAYEMGVTIGAGSTFRHPTVDVIRELNSSYREFQELLVTRNFDFFLVETALAALPTARADTNENYSLIDWPVVAMVIRRIDTYVGGAWQKLEEIDWASIRLVTPIQGSQSSHRPLFFAPKSHGTVTGATATAGKIAIAPFCASGTYKMSYLPRWDDITTPAHLFIYPSETGARWHVWNTCARITIRDEDPGKVHAKTLAERAECEKRIGSYVARTISTGPQHVARNHRYW